MPIYEYRCGTCHRRVSLFSRGFDGPSVLKCPQCGGQELARLFSRFSLGKGETYLKKGIYEDILGDRQLVKGLESNDPRSFAEWNRRMSHGANEQIAPEYEDTLGKLDAGQPIEQVMQETKAAMKQADAGGSGD